MKIELKSVKFSEALSEETNAFTANLYINGKKVGYCKNQGHGGCTDYYPDKPEHRQVIADAEAYCKTLPDINYGTFSIKNNLEHTIDQLFEDWLKAKETKKLERKMKTHVIAGVPNANSYYQWKYKRPLSEIPTSILQQSINRIKAQLKSNEVILNTNLSDLGITV